MKITINQTVLNGVITTVSRAASTRGHIPILSGIYLSAEGESLTVRASDLETAIETRVACRVERNGATVINAKALGDLVKRAPATDLRITLNDNGTVTFEWDRAKYTLPALNATEFPNLPTVSDGVEFTVTQSDLRELVRHTAFAVGVDESKKWLTGVRWELKGDTLRAIATDTSLLVWDSIPARNPAGGSFVRVLPSGPVKDVAQLLGSDGDVTVYVTSNHALFDLGDTTIVTRLLEGDYPDYTTLISATHETSATINRGEFTDTLERAIAVVDRGLRLTFDADHIAFECKKAERGQLDESVSARVDGEAKFILLNAKYLLDCMKVVDVPDVTLHITSDKLPIVVEPSGLTCRFALMPLLVL